MASISTLINNIRAAIFGKDVRESIASGIEAINTEVESTTTKENNLESQFNSLVINAGSSNAEIVSGRTSTVTGQTFDTMGHRIDDHDTQLADIVTLKPITINMKNPPKVQFEGSLLVGAKGDGVTDDTAAINKIIRYGYSLGDSYYPLYDFPSGIFCISSPILHNQVGNYSDIKGAGIRQTQFKAIAAMTNMLVASDAVGFHGYKHINGFTFNGNNLATNGIEASNLHYSTIEKNEFVGIATDGYAIKWGGWVNKFLNNLIAGYNNATDKIKTFNGIYLSNVINNVVVEGNSFTCCKIGVVNSVLGHDLHIDENSFDTCGNAFVSQNGLYNCSFDKNYVEACGDGYVTVPTSASTTEQWQGAIIGYVIYNMIQSYFYENFSIEENEFANIKSTNIITLSNLNGVYIRKNNTMVGYNYNALLNIKWEGSPYYKTGIVEVEHNSTSGQFTKLVDYGTIASRNRCRIKIKDYLNKYNINNRDLFGSLSTFTTNGGITFAQDSTYEGLPIYKISGITNGTAYFSKSIPLLSPSSIVGRYFRIKGIYKGDTGLSQGLALTLKDQSNNVLYSNTNTYEAWRQFYDELVYIPSTVTTLTITATGYAANNNLWICDVQIVPAYMDL